MLLGEEGALVADKLGVVKDTEILNVRGRDWNVFLENSKGWPAEETGVMRYNAWRGLSLRVLRDSGCVRELLHEDSQTNRIGNGCRNETKGFLATRCRRSRSGRVGSA